MRNHAARSATTGRLVTILAVVGTLLVALSATPAHALSPTTFDSSMWQVNGRVRAIVETPSATYIAGQFTALIGPQGQAVPRSNIAAIDPTTGAPLNELFDVNKPVYGIAVSADYSTIYAVGDFNLANNTSRKRGAAFDTATGTTLAWNPNLGGRGLSLAVLGPRVYIGGEFVTINGTVARNHLAAVDATSGALVTSWTATANDNVDTIAVASDGSKVFVGGLFSGISGSSGTTQRRIASLNPTTGALLPWGNHPTYEVFDLEVSATQVFAAAGGAGGHAMGYDLSGNQLWAGFGDGDAVAVELQNDVLYIGGHMTTWGGVAANHVLAVNAATGVRIPWTVKVNSNLGIFSMASFKGHLSIGGDFTKVNSLARQHYARFNENLDPIPPTTPGKPSASADSATGVDLVWNASTDNVANSITYTIFRDGPSNPVGQLTSSSTTTVSFTDTNLGLESTHTWQVQASDGVNVSPLGPVSDAFTLPPSDVPLLTSLTMLDTNENGKVDTVTATFSSDVTCVAPCTSPWSLANVPSGGSLQSVATSGDTATLTLAEGPGAADTSAGAFTVALSADPVNGIVDADGDAASFDPTTPADAAGPVPVDFDSTDGVTPNWMEPGDTFSVTFSEPIDPASVHAANVKELDPAGDNPDRIIIVGLTDGAMSLGDDNIVIPNKGTIVYQASTLTLLNGNTTIMSTVIGSCTGTACVGGEGFSTLQPVTFVPEPTLRDPAGNGAGGSYTEDLAIF